MNSFIYRNKQLLLISICLIFITTLLQCNEKTSKWVLDGGYIETTPPVIRITSPKANTIVDKNIDIIGEAYDNVAIEVVQISIDGTEFIDVTNTGDKFSTWKYIWLVAEPENGKHNFKLKATDINNNSTITEIDLILDKEYPVVTVTSPTENDYVSQQIDIKGTSSDKNGIMKVEYVANSNEYQAVEPLNNNYDEWIVKSFNTERYQDGELKVYVKATDNSGNSTEVKHVLFIDNTAPRGEITNPKNGQRLGGKITIEGNSYDELVNEVSSGVGNLEYSIDDSSDKSFSKIKDFDDELKNWQFSYDTTTLALGSHTIYVRITDKMGNSKIISSSIEVDNTTSLLETTSHSDNSYIKALTLIEGTIFDVDLEKIEYKIDAGSFETATFNSTNWSFTINTSILSEGPLTITIRATSEDSSYVENSLTLNVDNTAPTNIILTSPSSSPDNGVNGSYSFQGTAQDNYAIDKIEFQFPYPTGATSNTSISGSATNKTWTKVFDTGPVTSGTQQLLITAYDKAGNKSSSVFSIYVDHENPTAELFEPENNSYVGASTVDLSGRIYDDYGFGTIPLYIRISNLSTKTPSITGTGTTRNFSYSGYNISSLGNAAYPVRAYVRDKLNNNSGWQDIGTIKVDKYNPQLTITNPANSTDHKNSVSCSGTMSDDNSWDSGIESVQVMVTGGSYINALIDTNTNTWSLDYSTASSSFTTDYKTLYVKAIDKAGNQRILTRSIYIDKSGPTAAITSPSTSGKAVSGNYTFTGTAEDDGYETSVTLLEIRVDTSLVYTAATGTSSWSYTYDTATLNLGYHTIRIKSTDSFGNVRTQTFSSYYKTPWKRLAPMLAALTDKLGIVLSSDSSHFITYGGQAGGTSDSNLVQIYNIASNTWTYSTIDLPEGRGEIAYARYYNGSSWIAAAIGGRGSSSGYSQDVYTIQIANNDVSGSWVDNVVPNPTGVANYNPIAVKSPTSNSCIFLAYSSNIYRWCNGNPSWTLLSLGTPTPPTDLRDATMIAGSGNLNNYVYILDKDSTNTFVHRVYMSTNKWSSSKPKNINYRIGDGAAGGCVSDDIYVIFSRNNSHNYGICEVWELSYPASILSTWVHHSDIPMPTCRMETSYITHNGRIYVLGGGDNFSTGNIYNTFEVFDPQYK